jgi:hypothetical protein
MPQSGPLSVFPKRFQYRVVKIHAESEREILSGFFEPLNPSVDIRAKNAVEKQAQGAAWRAQYINLPVNPPASAKPGKNNQFSSAGPSLFTIWRVPDQDRITFSSVGFAGTPRQL